jgi:hypothetical protein
MPQPNDCYSYQYSFFILYHNFYCSCRYGCCRCPQCDGAILKYIYFLVHKALAVVANCLSQPDYFQLDSKLNEITKIRLKRVSIIYQISLLTYKYITMNTCLKKF